MPASQQAHRRQQIKRIDEGEVVEGGWRMGWSGGEQAGSATDDTHEPIPAEKVGGVVIPQRREARP